MQKITGAVLLLIGLAMLIFAPKIADVFGSQVQPLFSGAPTDRTTYLHIGGVVLVLLGIAQFFWKRRKS
jgi:hypothetical protein